MKILNKIENMSIPGSIMLSGLIIGFSIFFTTWIFFGGYNNRQKIFTPNPQINKTVQVNALTPQQLQQIQQRATMMNQASSAQQITRPATTTSVKVIKK